MRSVRSLLITATLLTLGAIPALAQLGARSVEVEPFVGWLSFDDDLLLASSIGFGGRLGYNLTDNWAIEGTFNYTPGAEFDLEGFDDDVEDDLDIPQTTVMLAHANLNYNVLLNNSRLVPFLTAGGGIASFNVDNDDGIDEDSSTDGEVNAGGGLKLFLSETVALRGDLRNHWIFASVPNEDPDESGDEEDAVTTSNLELSGGVSFNF
ncbi:MAG: outer membrane beta-barrel domain-containing protein [Gemmatimonadetes bacterium]|nr:outer membrane beta-barrel domain-containing protein [Gemmatimonadota bacterium]